MSWFYEKINDSRYVSLSSLVLKEKGITVRVFTLVHVNEVYELRESTPSKKRNKPLSGRGWSSNQTQLNCSDTLRKIVRDNRYPDIPLDIMIDIEKNFDE